MNDRSANTARIVASLARIRSPAGSDEPDPSNRARRRSGQSVARRRSRGRPARRWRPPRPRPRSPRSCPSTGPGRDAGSDPGPQLLREAPAGRRSRRAPPPAEATSRPTVIRPASSKRARSAADRAGPAATASGCEAGLRRVLVDVDLEVDRQALSGVDRRLGRQAANLADEAIEAPGEVHRIDRLDDGAQLDGPARLVRLQRADEVPRRAGQSRRLARPVPGRGSRRAA